MQSAKLVEVRDGAQAAARDAAQLLLDYFSGESTPELSTKSSLVDLVSTADTEAECLLRERLAAVLPSAGFIGEESTSEEDQRQEFNWVVDPLDGTSNFLSGLPIWSISIALTDATLQPLAGVVYAPVLNEMWDAAQGCGCRRNGQSCCVRASAPGGGLHNAMLATGFPYAVTEGRAQLNLDNFTRLQQRWHKIRRMGSAAIDLAYLASGVFDGMWELLLQPWDSAAGMSLVLEAGGKISRFDGSPYTPGDSDLLAAATAELHTAMAAELET